MRPCGQNCPRVEGQGAKKEVCLVYRILVFYFFLLMVLHDVTFNVKFCYNLNMKFFIIFFKKFYKVHSLEVLSQDSHQQKEI
jgi:hypothetical protein